MHTLHLGMESEELVLQIAAALQPLQSSHGLFQMVLAGNESKAPLGTGFRGHFVRIVSTQPTPALLPASERQCSGFSKEVVLSELFNVPAPTMDRLRGPPARIARKKACADVL